MITLFLQTNKIDMSDVVPPFKKNFRDCSPHMANSLQESIQNDIDTSERNKTFCLKSYHVYNINLPNLTLYPEGFRHFYLLNILDTDIRQELQDNKVINWCRSAKTLYPLKTKGKMLIKNIIIFTYIYFIDYRWSPAYI